MKKFFPLTDTALKSVTHLIVVVLAYCLVAWLIGVVAGLISIIPIISIITDIIAWLVRIYCAVGAIVAILYYFNILK